MPSSLLPHTLTFLLPSYARERIPISNFSPYKAWFLPLRSLPRDWKISSTKFCLLLRAHWQQPWQGPKEESGRCVLIGDSVPLLIAINTLKPLSGGSKEDSSWRCELRAASWELRVVILRLAMTHWRAAGKPIHLLCVLPCIHLQNLEKLTQFPDRDVLWCGHS